MRCLPCSSLSRAPGVMLALAGALVAVACREASPRHDVVLITFDTTRADRLGAYGGNPALSPEFDHFAATGVLFERAQAHAAVTPVAHASIFTGLNPYRHGLRTMHGNRQFRLPAGAPTLAERFRELGYQTAGFVSAFPCSRRYGLERGFDVFDEEFAEGADPLIGPTGAVFTGFAQRDAARVTGAALEWLSRRDPARPFFLWVHYFDPHDPLIRPPGEFRSRFGETTPAQQEMDRAYADDPGSFLERYGTDRAAMEEWLLRQYDVEIAFADHHAGRLLAALESGRSAGRTLVAWTADHGEGLGDHDWWNHGIVYQEQLRVPLALAGPGLPAGLRIPDRVRHVDLAPTLLELATGTGFPEEVDGVPLLPLIRARQAGGEPPEAERPGPAYADSVMIMEYASMWMADERLDKDDQLYVWLEGDLKWIRHRLRPERSELYDLAADPGESRNLREERPDEAARLDGALLAEAPFTEGTDFSLPEDPEVLERLRSLGYID